MIVSVDHGNKSVKTPNFLFTSRIIVSEDKPALNVDYIFWVASIYPDRKANFLSPRQNEG